MGQPLVNGTNNCTIPSNIVVGATNASGVKSSYSTAGSAIWVSAPAGEFGLNAAFGFLPAACTPAIVTTDQSGLCDRCFKNECEHELFQQRRRPE